MDKHNNLDMICYFKARYLSVAVAKPAVFSRKKEE